MQKRRLHSGLHYAKQLVKPETASDDSPKRKSPVISSLERVIKINRIIRMKLKVYEAFSPEDRIAKLQEDIHELDLFESFPPHDHKALLEKMLIYEMAMQEKDHELNARSKMPVSNESILADELPERIIVTCTINELGFMLKEFISDTLNENGDHVFNKQIVTVSKWASLIVVRPDGTTISAVSILNCMKRRQKPGN